MPDKKALQRRRFSLWIVNPRCERCGIVTILPEMLDGVNYNHAGHLQLKTQPDNMATIQHKYFKLHPLRLTQPKKGERRWFLWCYKCNQDYFKKYEQPINNKRG